MIFCWYIISMCYICDKNVYGFFFFIFFEYYDFLFCKLLILYRLCRFLVGFLKKSENLVLIYMIDDVLIIECCIMI